MPKERPSSGPAVLPQELTGLPALAGPWRAWGEQELRRGIAKANAARRWKGRSGFASSALVHPRDTSRRWARVSLCPPRAPIFTPHRYEPPSPRGNRRL